MKKLLVLTGIMMLVFALSCVCFADVVATHTRANIYVTMTEPSFNKVVPTDISAGNDITVSNIVWKDSNGKVLANTEKITSGGTYTVSFDLNRKTGDRFGQITSVYINNSAVGVQKSVSSLDKMSASKSFSVAGGRLSNAHGKGDYLEGGESSTATTPDGKKVLGLIVILIDGNVEEGKALPTTFQLKTDLDTTFKTYSISKSTPSDTTKPYAVWQQYDEIAQAEKSYTVRYIFPIPSDVSVADDCRIEIDGKTATKAGLGGSLFFDTTYKAGGSLAASQIKYVTKVEFEDYVFPTAGQDYNPQDVKLKSGFPGEIESANFTMFQKNIGGEASKGDNVGLYIKVKLNSGYEYKEPNATLNGKTQDTRIHNDSFGSTLYGFVWNYIVPESATIKIQEQSPETVEFVEGEDVKLFVKATGVDSYQWSKFSVTGGVKQKFAPSTITGATNSEYVISKATADLDGAQYNCRLTAKDKSIAYTKTITLKLVEKKEETKPEETKQEEKVETIVWAKASSWALDELTKANNAGLIPTIFDKEDLTQNITRKEFAHVAVKLYEKVSGKTAKKVSDNPFTDTKDEEVLKAYNVGITAGMSATTFEPDLLITREQMATMMTRALSKAGIDTKVDLEKVKKFDDDAEMHSWGKESIYYMSSIDIIKGMGDNKFGVLGNATREQSLLISVRSAEKFAK